MLVGLLSFVGVIVGAVLQYFFTKHTEHQRHLRELRSKAYMDYLQCVCELAQFRPQNGTQEQRSLFAKTGDAKARICLYGSNKAILAFSNFERLGASMNTPQQREAFTSMVSIMRSDSGSKSCPEPSALQDIILGVD
ncbi:hypothetical protein PVT67_16055 [Gallaecimonas kandeliae]|uniref:hypothetical protein n=1 Tax=Gallaecimonas kandeliae TaxID=3029055 RepID=UPI0026478FE2|nr:hypothetical protein [Gallaecimonas kandeliae]WKE65157.1 hypothetical protein PVT67_16055 [Gallaecimonas kandeliae]